MGTANWTGDCYKCNGKGTLICESDTKLPYLNSGFCLKCGWQFYTLENTMSEKELKEKRQCYDYKEI